MYLKLLSVALIATCAIATPNSNEITQSDVDQAIQRISNELLNRFDEESGWESREHDNGWLSKSVGGTTAIATFALLQANQSAYTPTIKTSLGLLDSIQNPSTYVCSLRARIWCYLYRTHSKKIRTEVKRLVETLSPHCGGWGYDGAFPTSMDDSSHIIRQFGSIALLDAHHRGTTIPSQCFIAIAEAVLGTQHKDGGWSHEGDTSSLNTTIAGFNCLLTVKEVLGNALTMTQQNILNQGLQRAFDWLNREYAPSKNTGGTAMMSFLCSLERAASHCGLDQLKGKDWFREGVAAVLKAHCSQKKRVKGSTVNLSFALIFLTRGRIPLALVELRTDKTTLDVSRLSCKISASVSDQIEQTLGWRVVTEHDPIERWFQAPLVLLQDPLAIPDNLEQLTTYLDEGGLLVCIGDKKNAQQFSTLADRLCLGSSCTTTRNNHWSHSLIQDARGIQVTHWNDGVRDRVLLIQSNPKKYPTQKETQLSRIITSVCCGAAELAQWNTRLWSQELKLDPTCITLASFRGHWDAESSGIGTLGIESKPLSSIAGPNLILVGGIGASDATDAVAIDTITAATNGSIVLVEPVGGMGEFARVLRTKIGARTKALLDVDRDLQHAIHPIGVRGYTQRIRKRLGSPLVMKVGKGQIVFLEGDMRNALLAQPSWEIHGYDTATSVAILQALDSRRTSSFTNSIGN
ncbi:MAG: hypothetical protein QGI78_02420 [Phycisphaerales bacterium]|jgi:hypothetical protein|nr:hypothetical protein [Phycisphaerales bacterium]